MRTFGCWVQDTHSISEQFFKSPVEPQHITRWQHQYTIPVQSRVGETPKTGQPKWLKVHVHRASKKQSRPRQLREAFSQNKCLSPLSFLLERASGIQVELAKGTPSKFKRTHHRYQIQFECTAPGEVMSQLYKPPVLLAFCSGRGHGTWEPHEQSVDETENLEIWAEYAFNT